MVGSGISVVVIGFMNCEQRVQAVVLICLIGFFFNFGRGGSTCSPTDVAPRSAPRKFMPKILIAWFYTYNSFKAKV